MILWINGAFGAGKTTVANELNRRIENAYIYDPENAGYFIRKNIPQQINTEDNFQDYKLWRDFNLKMLRFIADSFDGTIIVPMTVTNRQYYDELILKLSERYIVKHFILYASKKVILKRLSTRFEGKNSWAAGKARECISAFNSDIPGIKIMTDNMGIDEITQRIGELSGIILNRDKRKKLTKKLNRLAVKLKNIRWF